MIASRLQMPVVPVRLDGRRPGAPHHVEDGPARARSVTFGAPMRLSGDDYAALARQVEEAVRRLHAAPGA